MVEQSWNAAGYAENARFVSDLGMPVLDWLAPRAGEHILDLGCGDGALTIHLQNAGVNVAAIDQSESMVEAARRLGLAARLGDMHEFDLARQFDAVFTNAVLHWCRDIGAVLRSVRRHLKPDGRFVGEFGGFGNVGAIVVAVRAALRLQGEAENGFRWYFPTVSEFAAALETEGFRPVRIELIPRPTPLPTGMRNWLETFARPYAGHLPDGRQNEVLDLATDLLATSLRDGNGHWTADYVRLRFHAERTPGAQS